MSDVQPADPPWAAYRDEELLAMRICDLGVRIGGELEACIGRLHTELGARGLTLFPECYLGDEWFTPTGRALIAVPFYLAHPRLRALELKQMLEVEGGTPESCLTLLRHECGHAFDHVYRFSHQPRWQKLFGRTDDDETPDVYHPRPYSKSFVRHLGNWYAQAHPDEDFAETFAVWLTLQPAEWRERYRGWKALAKLEYVNEIMREVAGTKVRVKKGRTGRIAEASRMKKTLARHYAERRKLNAEDFPDFYDADLRALFEQGDPSGESAARFMRQNRKIIVPTLVRWTGQHKYTVDQLVRRLTLRCESLGLQAPVRRERLLFDIGAYLSALVTNHLHTGHFKRSV